MSARHLSDDEDRLVRDYTDAGLVASRRSLCVVFSSAGGIASEVAAVRMCDIDLDAATVAFRGAAERDEPLDRWGVETVWRFVRNTPSWPMAICCAWRLAPTRRGPPTQ